MELNIAFNIEDLTVLDKDILVSLDQTYQAILSGEEVIHSTSVAILRFGFDLTTKYGYDIFIWKNGKRYQVRLGNDNDWTDKELREGHDLFKIVWGQIWRNESL